MKDKYNVEKKKIDVTSVPPSDWPCYERFDSLFASIIKIIGIPKVLIKVFTLLIESPRF